jgi:hypothetical protein
VIVLLSFLLFEGYTALVLFSMAPPGVARRSNSLVDVPANWRSATRYLRWACRTLTLPNAMPACVPGHPKAWLVDRLASAT